MATNSEIQIDATEAELTERIAAKLVASGVFQMSKGKRKKVNWESMMAREYVEKFYGEMPHWYRIEVGALPAGKTDPIYTKTRRWADCIIRTPEGITIVELKMLCKPDVYAQISNYAMLFKETPLFKKYWNEPVKLKVVCARIAEDTQRYLDTMGLEVEVYQPSFFDEWYAKVIEKKTE